MRMKSEVNRDAVGDRRGIYGEMSLRDTTDEMDELYR